MSWRTCPMMEEPFNIDMGRCPRCGLSAGSLAELNAAVAAARGSELQASDLDELAASLAWARCNAKSVYEAQSSVKAWRKDEPGIRADKTALERAETILVRCTNSKPDAGEFIALDVIRRKLREAEVLLKRGPDEALIREAMLRADPDVFKHIDVNLKTKHSLDVLVWFCIFEWFWLTEEQQPQIGRADDSRPTPFQRFMLAASEGIRDNRKTGGITTNSLCDRARHILGRRGSVGGKMGG